MKTMESQNIFLKLFQDDFKISLLKSINKAFNIVQPSWVLNIFLCILLAELLLNEDI